MADPFGAASAEILFALPVGDARHGPVPVPVTPCDCDTVLARQIIIAAVVGGVVIGALAAWLLVRGARK